MEAKLWQLLVDRAACLGWALPEFAKSHKHARWMGLILVLKAAHLVRPCSAARLVQKVHPSCTAAAAVCSIRAKKVVESCVF